MAKKLKCPSPETLRNLTDPNELKRIYCEGLEKITAYEPAGASVGCTDTLQLIAFQADSNLVFVGGMPLGNLKRQD